MRLSDIRSPEDLRGMSVDELKALAREIRDELIHTVSERGGHLASNLGVVELTIALHRVFDMPRDKIIFDVGHQTYVHKMLTGRYGAFRTLRSYGGIAGFPKRAESPYDVFETGHSSTAISAALGMARARDARGERHHVVAVVGDGALTGGMCYEALNDAGSSGTRLIVILNDNEMSIDRNVGSLARYLTDLRVSKGWRSTKEKVKRGLAKVPVIGEFLYKIVHRIKVFIKSFFVDEGFFSALGFHYFGPIDGHDLRGMERTLRLARDFDGPAVIHVLTHKGQGYDKAEEHPERFHGVPPFYVETGDAKKSSSLPAFGEVMAEELIALAENDPRICAISAAMLGGTGLHRFADRFPDRTFDTGIAEAHAATMAAGLAAGGMRPYFAVYDSFFQRAYDQLVHDVCMQGLPVTFLLDRAGLVGEDGATHHGLLDFAMTLPLPGITVLAPRDLNELRAMLRWTIHAEGPVAIRYGRKSADLGPQYPVQDPFTPGRWETLAEGTDGTVLAVGSMVLPVLSACEQLRRDGLSLRVVNASSVKPMDEDALRTAAAGPWFTAEEHMLTGGFGEQAEAFAVEHGLNPPLIRFGVPDRFVQHGAQRLLMEELGLSPEQLARAIRSAIDRGSAHDG